MRVVKKALTNTDATGHTGAPSPAREELPTDINDTLSFWECLNNCITGPETNDSALDTINSILSLVEEYRGHAMKGMSKVYLSEIASGLGTLNGQLSWKDPRTEESVGEVLAGIAEVWRSTNGIWEAIKANSKKNSPLRNMKSGCDFFKTEAEKLHKAYPHQFQNAVEAFAETLLSPALFCEKEALTIGRILLPHVFIAHEIKNPEQANPCQRSLVVYKHTIG